MGGTVLVGLVSWNLLGTSWGDHIWKERVRERVEIEATCLTYQPHPERFHLVLGWWVIESNPQSVSMTTQRGGGTHVMASNSATLVTKSISSGLTVDTRMTSLAPMYNTGKNMMGK